MATVDRALANIAVSKAANVLLELLKLAQPKALHQYTEAIRPCKSLTCFAEIPMPPATMRPGHSHWALLVDHLHYASAPLTFWNDLNPLWDQIVLQLLPTCKEHP